MKVLITGASGLIGGALKDWLLADGHSLVCQSRAFHEPEQNVEWIKHDLNRDSWDIPALRDIDVVYHLAGQTSTYSARENPIADLSANVLALINLLEHFRKQTRRPFVVLAGTATEVGLTDCLPIDEGMPDHPITYYDISKLTAEAYLKQYVREGFANGCILRLANVFGRSKPGQQSDRGILDKIFNRAIAGKTVTVYGDGNYLRDYVFIDDVVSALVLAAVNGDRTNGRMFLVGSGQGITLRDAFLKVVLLANKTSGTQAVIEYVSPPTDLSEIERRNAVIDSAAFKQATGWEPKFYFDAALLAAYSSFTERSIDISPNSGN